MTDPSELNPHTDLVFPTAPYDYDGYDITIDSNDEAANDEVISAGE
jgi:hypothetical protein